MVSRVIGFRIFIVLLLFYRPLALVGAVSLRKGGGLWLIIGGCRIGLGSLVFQPRWGEWYIDDGHEGFEGDELVVVEEEGSEFVEVGEVEAGREGGEFVVGEIDFDEIIVIFDVVELFE